MAKQSYMNTIKRNEGVNYSKSTVSCPRTYSLPGAAPRGLNPIDFSAIRAQGKKSDVGSVRCRLKTYVRKHKVSGLPRFIPLITSVPYKASVKLQSPTPYCWKQAVGRARAIDHPRQRVGATRKAICTTAVRMEATIPCTAPGALTAAKEEGLARACGTSSGTYRSCPFSRRTSTLSTPRYQSGRLLKPRHGAGKSRSQSRVGACLSPSTHLRRRRCQTTYSLK